MTHMGGTYFSRYLILIPQFSEKARIDDIDYHEPVFAGLRFFLKITQSEIPS